MPIYVRRYLQAISPAELCFLRPLSLRLLPSWVSFPGSFRSPILPRWTGRKFPTSEKPVSSRLSWLWFLLFGLIGGFIVPTKIQSQSFCRKKFLSHRVIPDSSVPQVFSQIYFFLALWNNHSEILLTDGWYEAMWLWSRFEGLLSLKIDYILDRIFDSRTLRRDLLIDTRKIVYIIGYDVLVLRQK